MNKHLLVLRREAESSVASFKNCVQINFARGGGGGSFRGLVNTMTNPLRKRMLMKWMGRVTTPSRRVQ